MIRALALALMLALTGPACADTTSRQVEIGPVAQGQSLISAAIVVRHSDAAFGGLSGLLVTDDGARFTAITDKGRWVEGRLTRENGRLTAVEVDRIAPILGPDGDPLTLYRRDSEGLATQGGDLLASFESADRIGRYAGLDAAEADTLPLNQPGLNVNSGIEALATHADGRILAISERNGGAFWITGRSIRPVAYPRRAVLRPTGADFGPDGRLYVVERGFSLLGGFTIELRRFDLAGDALVNGETLFRATSAQGADNMEGVSVWRAEDGLRALLVSDDNFNALQKTLFLELALP